MSAWARGKVLAGEEHGGVVFGTTGMQPASGPMPAHSLATRFRRITRYASFSSSVGCDERGAGRMHAPGIGTHNSHPQSAHACTQGMSMPALGTRSILCVRRLLAAYTTPPPCMDAGRWEQGDVYLMQGSAHGWFLLCLVDDCCPHRTPLPMHGRRLCGLMHGPGAQPMPLPGPVRLGAACCPRRTPLAPVP